MQITAKISSFYEQARIYENSRASDLPNFVEPEKNSRKDSLTISSSFAKKTKEQRGGATEESLSAEEKAVVEKLKQRDAEVRQHEQAHLSAGGGLVRGGASYSYQTGPDGKKYAIGGEVQIDISPESEPRATITKMQQVRRAALAPSDPSSQDRAVAALASKIEAEASAELREQTSDELKTAAGSNVSPQAKKALNAYRKANEL